MTDRNGLPEAALTVAEVAEALRVTPRTVRKMVRRGQLARLRPIPGSRQQYLIPRSELERFLEREGEEEQR